MNRKYSLVAIISIVIFLQGCEIMAPIVVMGALSLPAPSSDKTSSESAENSENLAAPSDNGSAKSSGFKFDVTGSYISEITVSGSAWGTKRFLERKDRKEVILKQTGNTILGTDRSKTFEINGTREGSTINFYIPRGNQIEGVWEINADATKLEGNWNTDGHGGASGKWNLTRVE